MSTYTSNKGYLEKPAHGSEPNTWDVPLNNSMDNIDASLGGSLSVNLAVSDATLSRSDARNLILNCSGAMTGNRNVTLPATVGGSWIVSNNCTGSYTVTVKCTGANTVSPAQGSATFIYSDGTNVYLADAGPYLSKAGGTLTGGLTLPSNGLTVGGSQLVVTGGNVTASGNITAAGNVTAYSDRRLKTNIRSIDNALDMICALEGVRYLDPAGQERVGLIAQEVREILPEVVFADKDGILHLAYQNLVGVLIEAVKELSARVDELEAKVE